MKKYRIKQLAQEAQKAKAQELKIKMEKAEPVDRKYIWSKMEEQVILDLSAYWGKGFIFRGGEQLIVMPNGMVLNDKK